MLEEKKKIKELFLLNKDGNNKKKIENLVAFIVILIITIILINTIWNGEENEKEKSESNTDKVLAEKTQINNTNQTESEEIELEQRLETILEKIEGVGEVKVLLTYSETSQTVAMYNEDSTKSDTEETDTGGGNRKVTQVSTKKEVIYQEVNGEKIPVTQSIMKPKIEGAIVTAVGAKNSEIKANIVQAVEAATRPCNTQNSSL